MIGRADAWEDETSPFAIQSSATGIRKLDQIDPPVNDEFRCTCATLIQMKSE